MSHQEEMPAMKLNMEGSEFEATPENTSLFKFIGNLACYSHVFMQTGDENGVPAGTYVFASHPVYSEMEAYMMQSGYPMHVNLREVAECDQRAYDKMIEQQVGDLNNGIPDEWLGEQK